MKYLALGLLLVSSAIHAGTGTPKKEESAGCRFTQIQKDSVWEKLGWKNGDVLISYNGKKCAGGDDIKNLFQEWANSKTVVVKIRRAGKIETFTYDVK